MQFRLLPAFLVFIGSYAPLTFILALQDIKEDSWRLNICLNFKDCVLPVFNHPYLSFFGIFLTTICFFMTIIILGRMRYKYPVEVKVAKPIPSELIGYSFPFIVSFVGVNYDSTGKIAGLVVFLIWLFLISYRAGTIIMNPILLILGWNLYEAEAEINGEKRVIKLLSSGNLIPGEYLCQGIQGSYITKGDAQE